MDTHHGLSPRAHAEKRRREWVREQAPTLVHDNGVIYTTASGTRVGIPLATEREPNRWFLGLPRDSFDEAVLLCEKDDGELVALHLNSTFLAEHGIRLSKSGTAVKFNACRSGGRFELAVPGCGRVVVDRYAGGFAAPA